MPADLSVILIVKNEQRDIKRCLESVQWADEIIIVDSGSTDQTLSIAKNYTNKIFLHDWQGYGRQKQYALSKATKSWVLSLDADEVVTEALKNEILGLFHNFEEQDHDAFQIPFQSYFLDQPVKHGDWKGEKHIRLFKRQKGSFDQAELHENLIIQGKIGKLKGRIDHYSYANLEDVLDKLSRYAIAGAKARYNQGKKSSFFYAWFKSKWAFFRSYVIKLGFLDGKIGFILAYYIADYTFYRYVKLIEMNKVR
ncbi:glycosyltransferase family 2 protein [Thiotrichales bacterium 19S9-12]|nr:glycosyltransferase family 2 protein [Thiotrichales bacterium 19S9-11]MCF6811116.1 glycosyltransferase family 2 protein [Thiotrichales bacterium 19S9-12]